MECSGVQLIVFTPLPVVLCTEKPQYHPSPPSVNTIAGQLPSAWSALLQNLILPLPGYLSLCPPDTRDILRTIIVFFSEAPSKPSTLPQVSAQLLIPPSTYLWTLYVRRFPTLLRKSLSSLSPQLTSCPYLWAGNCQSPTKPSELLLNSYSSLTG